ncbi:hypothetical protein H0H87_008459, partial [Tephrocybe sp. NHM501043]
MRLTTTPQCSLISITIFCPPCRCSCVGRFAAAATGYLIVGGGTAGLVLAQCLNEDPNVSLLVIEAGGDGLG